MKTLLVLGLMLAAVPGQASAGEGPLLTLDQAMDLAKKNNLDIKIAQERLNQAHLTAQKAWSYYLPQISIGGSYTHNNVQADFSLPTGYYVRDLCGAYASMPQAYQQCASQVGGPANDPSQPVSIPDNPPGTPTGYSMVPSSFQTLTLQKLNMVGAQATLNQALIAPTLWPAISNAYLAQKAAELNVDNARREILFLTAQFYYGVATIKEAVRINAQQLDVTKKHEHDAQVQFQSGAVQKAALLRAQIDRAKAEQDLRRTQASYAGARVALATVLDRDANFTVELPTEVQIPKDLEKLEEVALHERPDVESARVGTALADGQHTAAVLSYLPNLGFTGKYQISNVTGFTGSYDSWSVGLGLSWTIFDGTLREANLAETASKQAEAQLALQAKENTVRAEVIQAKLDLDSAIANREKSQEQLKLARENAQLVNVTYQAGASTYLEVEDANTQLLGAEINAVTDQLSANLAALKVLKAAGRFNP